MSFCAYEPSVFLLSELPSHSYACFSLDVCALVNFVTFHILDITVRYVCCKDFLLEYNIVIILWKGYFAENVLCFEVQFIPFYFNGLRSFVSNFII